MKSKDETSRRRAVPQERGRSPVGRQSVARAAQGNRRRRYRAAELPARLHRFARPLYRTRMAQGVLTIPALPFGGGAGCVGRDESPRIQELRGAGRPAVTRAERGGIGAPAPELPAAPGDRTRAVQGRGVYVREALGGTG